MGTENRELGNRKEETGRSKATGIQRIATDSKIAMPEEATKNEIQVDGNRRVCFPEFSRDYLSEPRSQAEYVVQGYCNLSNSPATDSGMH